MTQTFNRQQFLDLQTLRGVLHVVSIAPASGTVGLRVVVEDAATGHFGSVNIPYAAMASSQPQPNTGLRPATKK
ncbi:MAG TPA: hypothetical protein VFA90_19560 [Terriglobales bacterium]|nr:hypothetical protein [Terriglobales bacterium]